MSRPPFASDARRVVGWSTLAVIVFVVVALAAGHLLALPILPAILALALLGAFVYCLRAELAMRSVAFLGVGSVAYLLAWNRGVPFLYACSAACFALVIASHLLPRWVLRPVRTRINCPSWVVQGDQASISIAVQNPSKVSLRLLELEIPLEGCLQPDQPTRALIVRLAPGGIAELLVQSPILRRGHHAVGPAVVSSGFPLGLVTKSLRLDDSERRIWVYPRLFSVALLPVAGEQFAVMGEAISPRAGGTEDFAGVREYRHGDSRKHIHWRSSAKHDQLVVKEYMRTSATTVTIAVDLGKHGALGEGLETASEYAISIAASVARYALAEGHYVQLAMCAAKTDFLGPLRLESDLERLLQALALARCDGEQSFDSHLPAIAARITPGSTAVLTYIDAQACAPTGIELLQRLGVLVVPIVVDAASFEDGQARTASADARPSYGRLRIARRGADMSRLFGA